jgi:S-DNA-T family DNA segregation ATPase FtsK/SpoIIIE
MARTPCRPTTLGTGTEPRPRAGPPASRQPHREGRRPGIAARIETPSIAGVSTVVVKRQPRRPAPEIPTGELVIEAPPEFPPQVASRWQQALQLVPMLTGAIATALLFAGRDGGTYTYVVGGIFGISTLGMLTTSWTGGPRRAEMTAARQEYLRHLAALRGRVRDTARRQRHGLFYRHPDPDRLWSTVASYRLWERRPGDGDFAVVRVGTGPQTLATPLAAAVTRPLAEFEPTTADALRRFLDTYSVLPDLPVAVSLRGFARVVVPDSAPGRDLVRAMLAQLAVFHAPTDLLIAICLAASRRPEWEWVKWLPHALHPERSDAAGPLRLVATSVSELEGWLHGVLGDRPRLPADSGGEPAIAGLEPLTGAESGATGFPSAFSGAAFSGALAGGSGITARGAGTRATPHLVVVFDGGDLTGGRYLTGDARLGGVTRIELGTPPPRLPERAAIVLDPAEGVGRCLRAATADDDVEVGTADRLSRAEAEALARRLAPLRLAVSAGTADAPPGQAPSLAELLGIGDPYEFGTGRGWLPRRQRDRLRVPIGVGPHAGPVELDLKESAQDGMGPHGLLIGATGSGKSELLRTLVLGLAATHPPDALNFVLIDFKGGATFAALARLPHVAALITNLADELPLVDRMTESLNGELVRRQELLRRSGNHASVHDYERARAGGAALAPLPSLLIVCDEFSELLAAKPDFIELFLQIGRLGRSLGMHLLLASQRLEEGRLRGLDTHLSYRIGLRTFSPLESRTVLGVPDAHELPRSPGHGYLRYGTEPLQRFSSAYVSGAYRAARVSTLDSVQARRVLDYGSRYTPQPDAAGSMPVGDRARPAVVATGAADQTAAEPGRRSLLDILVERMAGEGPAAHPVWLPPLDEPPTLDDLLGPVDVDPALGLVAGNPRLRGALQVPVAVVDRPFDQRREALWLPLVGAAGHVAVVGGPQSGKSTLLGTLAAALALTHTPAQVQIYCLDFGGGQLAALRGLPHVGGVAGRQDTAAVRRTVREVAGLLARRERDFPAIGIESMAAFRSRRAARAEVEVDGGAETEAGRRGEKHGDEYGDVFLVIDGWSTLRSEYDDLEPVVTDIATRGLSYGIHVVATASRWMDFRGAIRDLFGSRLELRLGDPADSLVSRRSAANVPERVPGRGLTVESLHFLAALPRLRGAGTRPGTSAEPAGRGETGTAADLVRAVAAAWRGPTAPPVRLLPPIVEYQAIESDRDPDNPLALPIGIGEADLRPVRVDFAAEPHMVVFGDAQCGKSAFLRALARTIVRRFDPERARIIVVDYRRSLLGAVESEHLIGYATTAGQTGDLVESVGRYMRERLPGPDVTAAQLRSRSWWTGPEAFVLVDDYDLVATGPTNPLLPLLDHLAQARDVGLHLVLTRRSGGAGRALYEPLLQRLRELSIPGLVMSGDRDEGPLVGAVRPAALPPGRGWFVTRRHGAHLIQLAHLPPN